MPRTLFAGSFKTGTNGHVGLIETFVRRAVQRRQLRALEDHELQDIGVSRVAAHREAGKPFWRA
ncbi:DUF1127 domain-containing protein [Pelagibius sp. Alg239-R121]|uniref:DUF1127 domain-containing protein n=1 Tax=Pelagibius sp. Alg239-R121 TaxID=2993448 RepID=UPI0024A6DB3C|nr:DUF1127 domain-containing protein [Pelagibius sp. Alg239-R121]